MGLKKIHRRVRAGLSSQEVVGLFVIGEAKELGLEARVTRRAKFGQKSNDVVMKIGGVTVSLEVKGVDGFTRPLPLFDKSVRRRNVPPEIETMAQSYMETISLGGGRLGVVMDKAGYSRTFLGKLDFYRAHVDPTVGLAEDSGSSKSGKLPRDLQTTLAATTRVARNLVLDNLKSGGDSYFAVHDKKTDEVHLWYTGVGPNPLNAKPFPTVKMVLMDTYGGASAGATRVAIKIKL